MEVRLIREGKVFTRFYNIEYSLSETEIFKFSSLLSIVFIILVIFNVSHL